MVQCVRNVVLSLPMHAHTYFSEVFGPGHHNNSGRLLAGESSLNVIAQRRRTRIQARATHNTTGTPCMSHRSLATQSLMICAPQPLAISHLGTSVARISRGALRPPTPSQLLPMALAPVLPLSMKARLHLSRRPVPAMLPLRALTSPRRLLMPRGPRPLTNVVSVLRSLLAHCLSVTSRYSRILCCSVVYWYPASNNKFQLLGYYARRL